MRWRTSVVRGFGFVARLQGAEFTTVETLVRSLRITDSKRVLLSEEGHSDSGFFVIFLEDRLQEGQKVLGLLRVFLSGYISAQLAHQINVIHTNAVLPPARDEAFSYGRQQ